MNPTADNEYAELLKIVAGAPEIEILAIPITEHEEDENDNEDDGCST